MSIWIIVVVLVVLVVGFYGWYMALIKRRNSAREALSSIDVQLLKRHDLLPNVLKIAHRYLKHEKDLLEAITEQRAAAMKDYRPDDPEEVKAHLSAAGALQGSMVRLFAVAENYPDLTANESLITAQHTFTEVEGHIAAARRFYNSAVTTLNNSVQIFPGNIIASMAGVKEMPFFEIEDPEAREAIDASEFLT